MGFQFARISRLEEARLWYDSRNINFLSVTWLATVFQISIPNSCGSIIQMSNGVAKKLWKLKGPACLNL